MQRVLKSLYGLLALVVAFSWWTNVSSDTWVKALEFTAVVFVAYMVLRIIEVSTQLPKPVIYTIPLGLHVPDSISRQGMPKLVSDHLTPEQTQGRRSNPVWEMIVAVRTAIINAANQQSVQSLVDARFRNLRTKAVERFAPVTSNINTVAFEGIMGTLLGMMVFMAQASGLFEIPSGEIEPAAFAGVLMSNLSQVDLLIVMTAFITSLMGWASKAWIGRIVSGRRSSELESITAIEEFFQVEVLARLNLPSQMVVGHTLSQHAWDAIISRALRFRLRYVNGGMIAEVLAPEPQSPLSLDPDPDPTIRE
jgi:hypothetical protein